jgi:UPF0755 protein
MIRVALLLGLVVGTSAMAVGCGEGEPAREVEVVIAPGMGAVEIGRQLKEEGLVRYPRLFALTARLKGWDGSLKSGRYRFSSDQSWSEILSAMSRGEVVTFPLTVPEGFTVREVAPRVASISGVTEDSVRQLAADTALARSLEVPGPTLEGYLFPETYRFAEGVEPEFALRTMVEGYRRYWTSRRRLLADSLGLSEVEVVTLASIVEKEARVAEERPVIAGVYLNRLEIGMLLQADPTVQYALGEPKERLLYADIERVADHPYNTYTHAGLPPGPIASPGEAALDAVLEPAEVPFLFFVARPDGSHVFTRTEREHINAKNRIRSER